MLTVTAPAKINLFLHVTGKRPDGYHALESLIAFTDFADRLVFQPSAALSLKVTGPFASGVPTDSSNLILRVAEKLNRHLGIKKGVHIALEKKLPASAGLGGGSADAAATFSALNQLWDLRLSLETMCNLALPLGADIPVCLIGKPAFIQGIGEKITPCAPFPLLHILLVSPRIPLATASVFAQNFSYFSTPRASLPFGFPDSKSLQSFLATTRNDLTVHAQQLVPEIDIVLTAIQECDGCLLSRMSGSGATCFGLFDNADTLKEAIYALRETHPGWWAQSAKIGSIL